MAFPTVAARTETQLANGSSLTINFVQTTGALVVIFLGLSDTAQALATVGDGFTDMTAASATFHILRKILDGSEGGTLVVTVASNTKGAALAYNVQGFNASIAPEFSAVATGTDANPNPGLLTPNGGSKDYLFLAAFRQNGEEADDDTWTSGFPANYSNGVQKTSGTSGLPATNGSVAAADRALTAASDDPGTFTTAQSLAWRAYTVAVHPIVNTTVTPGVASLALSGFAPTVTATVNQLVTPGTASLTTARFAPTVSAPRLVTPGPGSLALSAFAPSVSAPRLVTPSTAALTLAPFAPTVLAPRLVSPDPAALALSAFAPTVSSPSLATPGVASLALVTFAPEVTVSGGGGITVTPGTASLAVTAYAPAVSAPRLVTPGLATLALTAFAPSVAAPRTVTPGVVLLTLTPYAPLVVSDNKRVPGTATLLLTAFAPSVIVTMIVFGGPGPLAIAVILAPQAAAEVSPVPQGMAGVIVPQASATVPLLPKGEAIQPKPEH